MILVGKNTMLMATQTLCFISLLAENTVFFWRIFLCELEVKTTKQQQKQNTWNLKLLSWKGAECSETDSKVRRVIFRAGNTHSRLAARVVDCQMAWRTWGKAECRGSAQENHGSKYIIQYSILAQLIIQNNSMIFLYLFFLEKPSVYCLKQKTAGGISIWIKLMLRWTFLVWTSCLARWHQI